MTAGGTLGTDGKFSEMVYQIPHLVDIAIGNIPHHVTQRGNARQFLLAAESEKANRSKSDLSPSCPRT
jgi:hypothetical protein